jgi:3-oxoacyl-[acyl-carrier protein] reductase
MDLKLTGKRALVTGSSSGLGEAVARLLAAEGAEVIVHGRDADRARAVADSMPSGTCRPMKVPMPLRRQRWREGTSVFW